MTVATLSVSLRQDKIRSVGRDGATAALAVGQALHIESGIIGVCPEAAVATIGDTGPTQAIISSDNDTTAYDLFHLIAA